MIVLVTNKFIIRLKFPNNAFFEFRSYDQEIKSLLEIWTS
jgi:hypothetical protein